MTLLTAMTALTGWRLAALAALKKSLLYRRLRGSCERMAALTRLTGLTRLTPMTTGSTRTIRSHNHRGVCHV